MNRTKKFFIIQISLSGFISSFGFYKALKGISISLASDDGFETAAAFCWIGVAILGSLITLHYIGSFKKNFFSNKTEKDKVPITYCASNSSWEVRNKKIPYKCNECGKLSFKKYTKCSSCHSIMSNGDVEKYAGG